VDGAVKKRVEDVMPIATGHEREELEAELEVLFSPPVFGKWEREMGMAFPIMLKNNKKMNCSVINFFWFLILICMKWEVITCMKWEMELSALSLVFIVTFANAWFFF